MQIQHEKGRFFIRHEGEELAELVYSMSTDNIMTIEHTEVDSSLEGKGVGLQLVTHAVEYARAHQLQVVPQCSFARAIFKKKTEFQDVLAK